MPQPDTMPIADLQLDVRNPRMNLAQATQEAAEDYLLDFEDVAELVQSIGTSGWLEFEPLIVLRDSSTPFTVLEGNRRLVALRVLTDPALRTRRRLTIDPSWSDNAPERVGVVIVDSRETARNFIGFKHINGPHTWDSLAKAKFATQWLDDEGAPSLDEISLRLGDRNNTVRRLVNGYRVLEQARGLGIEFGQQGRPFSFSHLYTGISYGPVRGYLGLSEAATTVFSPNPVRVDQFEQLQRFLVWLYGHKSTPPIVKTQNPDLTRLRVVLANATATQMLENTGSLDAAYDIAENKASAFSSAVFQLRAAASEALRLQSGFDGSSTLFDVLADAGKDVALLVNGAKQFVESAEPSERDVE
ncbi:MAG: hypothetical protein ACYC90_04995 [Candidatus Nanopelagicales bacterium]